MSTDAEWLTPAFFGEILFSGAHKTSRFTHYHSLFISRSYCEIISVGHFTSHRQKHDRWAVFVKDILQ